MKLLRAQFQNFRLLRDLEVNFSCDPKKNLTVIRAANESGKTTLLHALQWGLYGDAALPGKGDDFRLHPIDWDAATGRRVPIVATVEFEVTTYRRTADSTRETRRRYRIVRSAQEEVDGKRTPSTVTLFALDETGATPIDAPESLINEELPPELRDVFFTDGDRALSFIEADVARSTKRERVQRAIRALLGLEPRLASADDGLAAQLTEGIVATINRLARIMAPLYDHGQGLEILSRVFQELDRRVGAEPRKANRQLRQTWMRLSLELKSGHVTHLDEPTKARLRAAADYELGYARKSLRESDGPSAEQWLTQTLPAIDAAANILVQLLPLWDTMRPLLLILRELKVPAVAPDMRYWTDDWHTPDAPPPWSHIPERLVGLFHACVREEQQRDEDLTDLRGRFARFCLERLKSKDAGQPPVEPEPRWRWAYIRAARELRINPEGSGHHILHHVSKSDPDPDVQAEAQAAYEEMRHGPKLPRGLSPRRTATEAIVWLFQAHFLNVSPEGTTINPHEVQRTREEIARRTTEPRWETKEARKSNPSP